MRLLSDLFNNTNYTVTLIGKLKDAFCEEMNAWYQYILVEPFLEGFQSKSIKEDYLENASQELEHAQILLRRIKELGGDLTSIDTPECWNLQATHKYLKPTGFDTESSVRLMIEAERSAIETYEYIDEFTKDLDPATNEKVKKILADEREHLAEMEKFLKKMLNK